MRGKLKCAKCGNDVDQAMVDLKKSMTSKLYAVPNISPPKVCSDCAWGTIVYFASGEPNRSQ